MSKVFKVKFKRKVFVNSQYSIPEGFEIQVVSTSSKPSETNIKEALEKQGLWKKSLSTSLSNTYIVLE
jgi:hypothetical protein